MKARVIYIVGNFESPTELVSFLLEKGVELHDMRIYMGEDGRWRGSGQVEVASARASTD